ncbi:SH3 domain-containing protein [Halovulum marinum]|nr:SH3 domain-containing protein [Halovulum marinum]
MADFYSDIINWTTASVVGGAVLLAGAEFDAPGASDEPVLLAAAADSAAESIMRETMAQERALSVTATPAFAEVPAETADAAPRASRLPQIKPAKLEKVVFTNVGDSSGMSPIQPEPQDLLEKGRVTAQAVNLRAGPGTRFAVVGRGNSGQELLVTGETDGVWVQILTPDGDEGWVHGRYFRTPEQLAAN